MEDVVITSGVRTAIGKFQGSLADVPASDLAAHVIREAVSRAGIAPESVDQVVMGIVGQVAEDAYLSRHSAVKAGLPVGTPAMNVTASAVPGSMRSKSSRIFLCGDAEVVLRRRREHDAHALLPARARGGYRLGSTASKTASSTC